MNKHIAAAQIPRKGRIPVSRVVTYLILIVWGITTVYPFLWVIVNSFKERGAIRADSFSIVCRWSQNFTHVNYESAMQRSDYSNA